MRRVYLSFLGLGQFDKETGKYSYRKTVYELNGKVSSETQFVQVAEQELLGWNHFDKLFIAATEASYKEHGSSLSKQLDSCRGTIDFLILDEEMTARGQWKWFEKVASVIEKQDILTVDLTHGYRSIPVIFSTAINFLQKTKQIEIEHVFYGAYEKDQKRAPLVDMRSFYDINVWADAVGRLTEDADASGLAFAARQTSRLQFGELSDSGFVKSCERLTQLIKNVDVNNVPEEAANLLNIIETLKKKSKAESGYLLKIVEEKFQSIARGAGNPDRKGYTLKYFRQQLELARLLMEHGLLMQAFTVMREWLSSLVMLHFEKENLKTKKRRKRRQYYGETFFNMLQFPEAEWKFQGEERKKFEVLIEYYRILERENIIEELLVTPRPAKELAKYRNGLDHAWIGTAGMKEDIANKARDFLRLLSRVLERLKHSSFIAKQQNNL